MMGVRRPMVSPKISHHPFAHLVQITVQAVARWQARGPVIGALLGGASTIKPECVDHVTLYALMIVSVQPAEQENVMESADQATG